jgi:hypothetical protein
MADEKPEQQATQMIPAKDGDIEVPVPSREDFLSVVEKVAGLRKPPAETDQPPEQSESD